MKPQAKRNLAKNKSKSVNTLAPTWKTNLEPMPYRYTLAMDLGGTKVATAVVRSDGKILNQLREPAQIKEGPEALLSQLARLLQAVKKGLEIEVELKTLGLASAGPIDIEKGILLDPTNFRGPNGKRYGLFPLKKKLEKATSLSIRMENDAAAAMLAELWQGQAKPNSMVITLGTGLGVGAVCNGELVRAGRMQHPEGGHLILNATDFSALCGCGNYGCAEAYLSGKNFTLAANARLGKDYKTEDLVKGARQKKSEFLQLFDDYSEWLAIFLHNCAIMYAPEEISFTGGFAAAHDLFLPQTQDRLSQLLERRRKGIDFVPTLRPSKLGNDLGIIGAAALILREK